MAPHGEPPSDLTRGLAIGIAALGLCIMGCASADVATPGPQPDAATTPDATKPGDQANRNDAPTTPDSGPVGPCDPFSGAGCPSDEKCTALYDDSKLALGCGSKEGDKSEGDECAPTPESGTQTGDDCGDGLACFNLKGEPYKCHRICPTSGTAHACPTGRICSLTFPSFPGLAGYGFCEPSCKPLEQSGCASGEACYLSAKGAGCKAAGSAKIGDTCDPSKLNDCEPGSTCVTGLSNGNRCLAFCSTSGGSPSCSGGVACSKVPVDDVFMSEPNVGYCR
jgi:hypothetical protein